MKKIHRVYLTHCLYTQNKSSTFLHHFVFLIISPSSSFPLPSLFSLIISPSLLTSPSLFMSSPPSVFAADFHVHVLAEDDTSLTVAKTSFLSMKLWPSVGGMNRVVVFPPDPRPKDSHEANFSFWSELVSSYCREESSSVLCRNGLISYGMSICPHNPLWNIKVVIFPCGNVSICVLPWKSCHITFLRGKSL